MKIAILGYSGCGKSTLAKYLQSHYHIPLLYLDTVQFEADWKVRDRDEALSMVAKFMENQDWIIDGNYTSFLQAERLEQADHIIFMAFSRWNCLSRAYRRYRRYKNTSRESMAVGCKEKMDLEFVWWILYKGRTPEKKRYYDAILDKYHAKSIVLKNQRELDNFMENQHLRGKQ
ncbi:DNA topology modulation protein [Blautia schinkii]|nr:DNA topology modulation protein [Blautia schinkii]